MKNIFIICIFFTIGSHAIAQEQILPKQFIYHLKDTLSWTSYISDSSLKSEKIERLQFYLAGKKKATSIQSFEQLPKVLNEKGLMLLDVSHKMRSLSQTALDLSAKYQKEDFLFLADTLRKSKNAKANIQYYQNQKVLFLTERGFGNLFDIENDQDLEIVLKQNPYFALYGDDITGLLLFKGKALPFVNIKLNNIKDGKSAFSQVISTDVNGQFYFKTNRLGIWLLESNYFIDQKNPEIHHTSFTFEFVK